MHTEDLTDIINLLSAFADSNFAPDYKETFDVEFRVISETVVQEEPKLSD